MYNTRQNSRVSGANVGIVTGQMKKSMQQKWKETEINSFLTK